MTTDPITAEATQKVVKEGGGLLISLLGAAFRVPMSGVKGVISGTVGNIWGIGLTTLGIMGFAKFMPKVLEGTPFKIGNKSLFDVIGDEVKEHGDGGLLKEAAILAIGGNAAWGAISGMLSEFGAEHKGAGGKLGGFIGNTVMVSILGFAGYELLEQTGTGLDFSHTDSAPKSPPPVTAKPPQTPTVPQK